MNKYALICHKDRRLTTQLLYFFNYKYACNKLVLCCVEILKENEEYIAI